MGSVPASDEDRMKRFASGGAMATASMAAGGIFLAVWQVLMARILGPADLGILGPFQSAFTFGAPLLTFGIPQTLATYVAHHYESDRAEAMAYIRDGQKLVTLIAGAASVLFLVPIAVLFLSGRASGFALAYAALLFAALFTHASFWTLNASLQGLHRLDLLAVVNFVFPVFHLPASVLAVYAARRAFGAESAADALGGALGFPAGGLLAMIAAFWLLKRTSGLGALELLAPSTYRGKFLAILRFGGLAALTVTAFFVLFNLPASLVGWMANLHGWLGPTAEANKLNSGYFSAAYMFSYPAMLTVGTVLALMPAISEAHGAGRMDLVRRYFGSGFRSCMTVLCGASFLYAVEGGPLVTLLNGAAYPAPRMQSATLLSMICASLNCMSNLYGNYMLSLKRPALGGALMTASVALQVAGILAAGKFAGTIEAVAAAMTATAVLTFAAFEWVMRTQFQTGFLLNAAVGPLAGGILGAMAVAAAKPHLPDSSLGTGMGVAVFLLVYGAVVSAAKRSGPALREN